MGEATHPGPSQESCRVSEEIVNCLEFDLTRVDKSTQLADRNVVRRLLDQGDPPRSSTKWFAALGEQEEYTMLDASTESDTESCVDVEHSNQRSARRLRLVLGSQWSQKHALCARSANSEWFGA